MRYEVHASIRMIVGLFLMVIGVILAVAGFVREQPLLTLLGLLLPLGAVLRYRTGKNRGRF
ncbi:MAG: hypothetical protein M3511_07945 [Deinococcota bacterium]|nr:hypothetical protein [Deinococcota bacterium]